MKAIILSILILITSCAATPTKGCGYARSQEKKLRKYHKHHRHHSKIFK